MRLLRENRFSVDPPYWGRALAITSGSLSNSVGSWLEERRFGDDVSRAEVKPPLFILGTWRSGTTFLHNLLSRDARFAFPNNYQVFYPNTFLRNERRYAKALGWFMPKKRPQDNVTMDIADPQEDEFALCSLAAPSVALGWGFPRNAARYDRYLTFRDATAEEVAEFRHSLLHFVRKLSSKYGKPLVLKSPAHTGRVRILLDMFPDARFIHIRRNPFDVFQSTEHMIRTVSPWHALQRANHDVRELVLRQYREIYDAYFDDLPMIATGRMCEIRFEDLEARPIEVLEGIYRDLGLQDFELARERVCAYVESLSTYRKNSFPALDCALRARIADEWGRCFAAWGYSTTASVDQT